MFSYTSKGYRYKYFEYLRVLYITNLGKCLICIKDLRLKHKSKELEH